MCAKYFINTPPPINKIIPARRQPGIEILLGIIIEIIIEIILEIIIESVIKIMIRIFIESLLDIIIEIVMEISPGQDNGAAKPGQWDRQALGQFAEH
jgi:hypothetical protein